MNLYISLAEESVLAGTPDESDTMDVNTNKIFSQNAPIIHKGCWLFDGEPKRLCLKATGEGAGFEKVPITLKKTWEW